MATKKNTGKASSKKKAPAAKPQYKQLGVEDFKAGLSYHVADGNGNVNPIAVQAKGNLSQQATKFHDNLIRGGVFASAAKPAKKAPATKVVKQRVSGKLNTHTAVGESKTRELPSKEVVKGQEDIAAGRDGQNTTDAPEA